MCISLDWFCSKSLRPLEIAALCVVWQIREVCSFFQVLLFMYACMYARILPSALILLFFSDSSDTNLKYLS